MKSREIETLLLLLENDPIIIQYADPEVLGIPLQLLLQVRGQIILMVSQDVVRRGNPRQAFHELMPALPAGKGPIRHVSCIDDEVRFLGSGPADQFKVPISKTSVMEIREMKNPEAVKGSRKLGKGQFQENLLKGLSEARSNGPSLDDLLCHNASFSVAKMLGPQKDLVVLVVGSGGGGSDHSDAHGSIVGIQHLLIMCR